MTITHTPLLLFLSFAATTLNAQDGEHSTPQTTTKGVHSQPWSGIYATTARLRNSSADTDKRIFDNTQGQKGANDTLYHATYLVSNTGLSLHSDTTMHCPHSQWVQHLDEVVVTGTRTEKRLSEAPILTTVVRDREIQKAGAVSTLEALEDNIPGIVTSPNAMGNNLRIKGLNSRYILFLVDGERMVSESAGGNVNLDQIDVNNIKRIEVIQGASSALYGSNAVGAVINIITKEPLHRFEGGATVQMESNNTLRAKVDAGANLGKIKTRINTFRHSSDGFGGDGNGAYAAQYTDWGGDLKIGYTPTASIDLNLTGRYYRHETFNPAGSLNSTHPLTHTLSVGFNGGYRSIDHRHTLRASVHVDKYFDMDYMEKLGSNKTNNKASYISSRILDRFQPTDRWEIVTGLEQNHEENYAIKTLGANPTTKKLDDYNVFGQAQWTPLKKFDVMLGARYTYNTQFNTAFTPKLSVMYRLQGFIFRGGVGSAFRAPSIKELYYDFDHQGMFWVYGNPDLKAEKGLYNSLSTEYTKSGFNISVSSYWNDINNKITQYDVINEQGGNEKYYKNVSSATLAGVDVNVSYLLWKALLLKSSYSYCDARDNSTGLQLSSNVKHSGTLSATWNGKIVRSPFSLQLAGRVNSPKLYQQSTTNGNGEQTIERSRSKPYNIWKVVVVKPLRMNKHLLELTLKCDNIFNFREDSFINPGRQYMVGLRYAFK